MNSKIIILLFVYLYTNPLFSQEIKINTGVALSSFKSKGISFLSSNITYPFVTVGADYLSHKYWHLSSEIGFMENGGLEKELEYFSSISHSETINLKEHWPTFHINTTFRVKIPARNSNFLIGIGPVLEIVLGDTNSKNNLYDFVAKRGSLGLKTDVGYEFSLKKGVKLGFVYSYIHTLTPFVEYNGKNLYNRASVFSLLLGYKL